MNQLQINLTKNKVLIAGLAFGLFVVVGIASMSISSELASALPTCMNNAGRRAAARNVSTVFPRNDTSVNVSAGCAPVSSNSQYVLISSYYHDGTGSPGSTLHTPNATFSIMSQGEPTAAVTVTVGRSLDANQRCNFTSGDDVVVANSSGTLYGSLDTATSVNLTIPASEFQLAEVNGQNIWRWTRDLRISGKINTSVHCRVRVGVWNPSMYVVLREDPNPTNAYSESQQRYNQNNAGTGGGPKTRLGPSTDTNGAVALYAELSGTDVLEYAIPFRMRCDINTAQTISIRFYDPDGPSPLNPPNTGQPAGQMALAVYNETTGEAVFDQNLTQGNDEYGEIRLTIQPDVVYTMVWYRVSARNGIQFWMPYSEATSRNGAVCAPSNNAPVITTTGPNCETFSLTVNDSDGDSVEIYLLVNGARVLLSGGGNDPTFNLTNQSAANASYSFPLQSWQDFSTRTFQVAVRDGTEVVTTANAAVGPCIRMTCGGVNPLGTVEIGRPFNLTINFIARKNYGDANTRNQLAQMGSRGTPANYGIGVSFNPNNVTGPTNPLPTGLTLTSTTNSTVSHTVGLYTAPTTPSDTAVTYFLDSANNNADVSCPNGGSPTVIPFAALPYIQTFGSDVIAGYGMKDAAGVCATNTTAGIRARTAPALNSTEIVGAGTQFGAYALGNIDSFRTATTQTGRNAVPWWLAFANATPPRGASSGASSGIFGGQFDSALCAENWFFDRPASAQIPSGAVSDPTAQVDLSTVRGVVRYDRSVRMRASAPLTGNRKVFVDGDIIIGDAAAAPQQYVYNTIWNSVYDIPTAILIATGNIYIDASVTKLEGILVAGGTVFTCVSSYAALPTQTTTISGAANPAVYRPGGACYNSPLTFQGALIASDVRLWRTGGTISKQVVNGTVQNATGIQLFNDGLTGAETFRTLPELFIAPRFGESPINGSTGKKRFDSLISLPPPF